MSKTIVFETEVLAQIQAHLVAAYPEEGCGFFAGIDGESRSVSAWFPVANVQAAGREKRFQIADIDYIRAEQWADDLGLTLLGIYHSHPDHPAYPSETDLQHAVSFFSYLIVKTSQHGASDSSSWQLNATGEFEEERVESLAKKLVIAAP